MNECVSSEVVKLSGVMIECAISAAAADMWLDGEAFLASVVAHLQASLKYAEKPTISQVLADDHKAELNIAIQQACDENGIDADEYRRIMMRCLREIGDNTSPEFKKPAEESLDPRLLWAGSVLRAKPHLMEEAIEDACEEFHLDSEDFIDTINIDIQAIIDTDERITITDAIANYDYHGAFDKALNEVCAATDGLNTEAFRKAVADKLIEKSSAIVGIAPLKESATDPAEAPV